MKDEINYKVLADFLGLESVDDITDDWMELEQVIVPIIFRYSGPYLQGEGTDSVVNITDYVNIQVSCIPVEELDIGFNMVAISIKDQLQDYIQEW